jgi:predicted transcriptional regulator
MSEYRLRDEVGSLLRSRRTTVGVTQERLARGAGVSQALVSKVERGVIDTSVDPWRGCSALSNFNHVSAWSGPERI